MNALAFSGSNYLFTMLRSSGVDDERKRHDKAVDQLQAAQASSSRKRTERLDFINEELRRQGHAIKTFWDVDAAMQERSYSAPHGSSRELLGAPLVYIWCAPDTHLASSLGATDAPLVYI